VPGIRFNRVVGYIVVSLILAFCQATTYAEPPADLYRAYYLENSARDYAAAKTLYDRVIADSGADESVRKQARLRADRCRDELAADNLASLVPPNVLGYVELRKPLALISSLAEAFGLAGKDIRDLLAERPDADATMPFTLPKQITLSPALVEALSSFGGAAVAITGLENPNQPSGLLIVHHGNDLLLKGVLETGFQFAPTARKIADLPTFGFQDKAIGVLTEALLIVGTSRNLVEEAVARLEGREGISLASRDDLKDVNARRAGATLFAYVDGRACIEQARKHLVSEHDQREFAQADAVLDFDHFRWATFAFGVRDKTISADLTVRMADDHRNLVFDLLRLPAMNRRTFGFVPADCAGVFGLGLNPVTAPSASRDDADKGSDHVRISGLDILREFFGNIQEVSAFVVPGSGASPSKKAGRRGSSERIPDAALVIASNDIRKSTALWSRILSLPAMAEGGAPAEPKAIDIAGTPARGFEIPEVGTVYLAELDGCLIVGTTKAAVRQSIQAHKKKKTIEDDAVMQAALKRVPSDSSLLLVVNGGRCAAIAASQASMGEAMPLNIGASAAKDTVVWFGLGQSASQMSLRIGVTGLPDLNQLIQTFRPMATAAIEQSMSSKPEVRREVKRRKQPIAVEE